MVKDAPRRSSSVLGRTAMLPPCRSTISLGFLKVRLQGSGVLPIRPDGEPNEPADANFRLEGRCCESFIAAENCPSGKPFIVEIRPSNRRGRAYRNCASPLSLSMLRIQDSGYRRCVGLVPGLLVGGRRPGRRRCWGSPPHGERTAKPQRSPRLLCHLWSCPPRIHSLRPETGSHRAVTYLSVAFPAPNWSARFDPSSKPSYHEMRHIPFCTSQVPATCGSQLCHFG